MRLSLSYKKGDDKLVRGCVKGDPEAQRQLYERFCEKMLAVCCRYGRDLADAEDILQEGFIRVFNKIHLFKGEGSLEGWIRRVIVNVALKHYHKNARLYVLVGLEEADREVDDHSLDDSLAYDELVEMVQSLPDGYRIVFNLYAIEGFSHKEIAQKLGISEGTSKSQLARARGALRNMLESQQRMVSSLTGNAKRTT